MRLFNITLLLMLSLSAFADTPNKVLLQVQLANGTMSRLYDANTESITFAYDVKFLSVVDLEKLTHLKRVELRGLDSLEDISFLANSPSLQQVYIDGCLKVKTVEALWSMPNLQVVAIRGCWGLLSKSPIEIHLGLSSLLVYLEIADSRLHKLPIIQNPPKSLRFVNFASNMLTSDEFKPQLPDGIRVFLFGNPIKIKSHRTNYVWTIEEFSKEVPTEYLGNY